MDVEAFEDGYIAKILVQEGDTATVGAAVALIAPTEAEIAAVAAGGAAPAAAAAAAAPADAAPGKFKTPERNLNPKP
jgi:pyruvate dehydrogenase E2 component (dihydrolipoamide acetyltransferase)